MYLKVIACEVLTREICHCVAETPHTVDVEFTKKEAHLDSKVLNKILQDKIDQIARVGRKKNGEPSYDAILLGYGLCGNATVNLTARDVKLVIPRAHDCCTLFLGSKLRFKEYFSNNLSQAFSSTGYCERGESYLREAREDKWPDNFRYYIDKYGEEDARYLWETLNPPYLKNDEKVIFISIPETSHLGFSSQCRIKAESEDREFVELPGEIGLIKKFIFGEWDEETFLQVFPGQRTIGIYDFDEIITVVED